MNNLLRFIQYNNAVPIALGILILGGASTFAATQPEAIFSSEQRIISVDNTYIADKDLSSYTPQVQITDVTEDADNYFVSYTFKTIDVQDYVWQDVEKANTISVAKSVLGEYGDLGLYVAGQLGQNIAHEGDRLKEVQVAERRNVTQKIVATAYGGLVGKLLDDKTDIFPGYTPVVTEPIPPEQEQMAAAAGSADTGSQNVDVESVPSAPPATQNALTREEVEQLIRERVAQLLADSASTPRPEGNTPSENPSQPIAGTSVPVISINGNNPANIKVGDTYGDLGAVIIGPTEADKNLGMHVSIDEGPEVTPDQINIDTSKSGIHKIVYTATNSTGAGSATRTVNVEALSSGAEEPREESPGNASPAESSTTTPATSSLAPSADATSTDSMEKDVPSSAPAEETATTTESI